MEFTCGEDNAREHQYAPDVLHLVSHLQVKYKHRIIHNYTYKTCTLTKTP